METLLLFKRSQKLLGAMAFVRSHSKAGKNRQLLGIGNLPHVWNTAADIANYSWKYLPHVKCVSQLDSCWQGNGWYPQEENKAKASFQIFLFLSFVWNKY